MKKGLRSAAELESVEARLTDIEKKLDRLRALYDAFFMGNERIPPNVLRRDANRLVLEMQQQPIGNATMRFRFQSVVQRWVMLTSYWNRTMREIEAGTYQRDLARAHRHMAGRGGGVLTEEEARELGIPASRVKAFVGRQQRVADARGVAAAKDAARSSGGAAEEAPSAEATGDRPPGIAVPPPTGDTSEDFAAEATQVTPPSASSPPQPARPARPAPARPRAPIPGLRDGELEAFYTRYVEAHQKASGAPPKASLEQLGEKLRQELPKLIGPTTNVRVSLDLAIEDGKVRLKARPVRGG